MYFDKDMYISPALEKKKDKLCRQLRYRYGHPSVYVIVWNENLERPEFLHSIYLKQKYYESTQMRVMGIVQSYEDALHFLAAYMAKEFSAVLTDKEQED